MKKEINKVLPAPNKLVASDAIAIPLDNGYWGYARISKDPMLFILNIISKDRRSLQDIQNADVAFSVEFYEPYDVSPWVYLGKWKFQSEDESWGPPVFIKDKIDPKRYRILHRGKMTNCTEEQIGGLNPHHMMAPEKIKQKILSEFKTFKVLK